MKGLLLLTTVIFVFSENIFAQQFTLYSSRWIDFNSKSKSSSHSVISIDSKHIIVLQGQSSLHLDIEERGQPVGNKLDSYIVKDNKDATGIVIFRPDSMFIEFKLQEQHLLYQIDSIKL